MFAFRRRSAQAPTTATPRGVAVLEETAPVHGAPQATTTTEEAPAETTPLTPRQVLESLESQALARGMGLKQLADIQQMGDCDAQVRARTAALRGWLAQHR